MVSAHLDELGLTVRGVDADGMLRVHRLGGMPERVLPGTRLVVHTRGGDLPAVVGLKSHHLTPPRTSTSRGPPQTSTSILALPIVMPRSRRAFESAIR